MTVKTWRLVSTPNLIPGWRIYSFLCEGRARVVYYCDHDQARSHVGVRCSSLRKGDPELSDIVARADAYIALTGSCEGFEVEDL